MHALNMLFLAITAAVSPAADKDADLKALTELAEATVRSINTGDAEANKQLFANDGDHINPMGRASCGPKEVSAMITDAITLFGTWTSKCRILDTRFLKPDVAIEVREWSMVKPPKGLDLKEPSPELLVHVKRDGQWKILAARPSIPFNPDTQIMPDRMPTAAGFSDPAVVKELKASKPSDVVAEDAIVLDGYGNIYRGGVEVQKFLSILREGRTEFKSTINSARRLGEDILLVDRAYEATGNWNLPKRGNITGTVRGLWFGVYSRQNDQWVLEAARVMIPYLPAK